jgi:hypothetical protein
MAEPLQLPLFPDQAALTRIRPERNEHQHAGGKVHAIGGEREGFGKAAAGIGQGHAEGARQTVCTFGLPEERVTLTVVTYFRAPSAV